MSMKHIPAFLALIVLPLAASRAQTTQPVLKLIPTPQQIEFSEGRFTFGAPTTVAVSNEADSFAAAQILEEVRNDLEITMKTGPVARAHIVLSRSGAPPAEKGAKEAYSLTITPQKIEIRASGAAGIFYGVQTLKQLVRGNCTDNSIPCLKIIDWPALKYRGWQDDISRGPIPTLDFLKREIRTLSEFKLNAMTLYTEHVFKLKKHPKIAPADGLSAAEIAELSDYAKKYHVELIGNFQSFGHFRKIVETPGYEHLSDDNWTISPAREETYQFLADAYSEVAPAYESALFDINCDEVSLNKGATKEMVDKLGLEKVYAMHINRIAQMLRKYGKTPMMWGDIAVKHPAIVPQLPKDLIVLSWGYSPRESFDNAIEPFKKIGLQFWVCPGVSCWNRIWPDFKTAEVNISNYVRDGVKNGAAGMLNTTWDDDGENFFNYNWWPLIWGAEVAWNPAMSDSRDSRRKEFDAAFASCFFGRDDQITSLLWALSNLRSNPASGGLSDKSFWRTEPAEKPPTLEEAKKLSTDGAKIVEQLNQKSKYNADTLAYAQFAARRAEFVGLRQQPDVPTDRLIQLAKDLKAEYARLWKLENRPWWLEENLRKYDDLIARLRLPATRP